jgi:hypothetical protein
VVKVCSDCSCVPTKGDIDTEKISCPIIRTDEHAFRGLAIWRPQHEEAVAHALTASDCHRFSWKSNRLNDTREQESDSYRRTEAAVDPLEHRARFLSRLSKQI